METFFGIPMERLSLAALCAVGALAAVLVVRGWRWPIFVRLGLRQPARRPAQTVLVVAGLALSSVLITASLATGDSLTHSLRSAAIAEIGRLDEVVTYSQIPAPGAAPTGSGSPFSSTSFFGQDVHDRLIDGVRADRQLDRHVAAAMPAIRFSCTLVNASGRQISAASVLGVPADYDRTFGVLAGASGGELRLDRLSAGEALLNDAGAGALAAGPGDTVSCTIAGVPLRWRVASVAAPGGLAGGATTVLVVPLHHLQHALQEAGLAAGVERPINQVWIANRGNALSGAQRGTEIAENVRALLADTGPVETVRALIHRGDVRAALAVRRGTLPLRTQALIEETLTAVDEEAPVERLDRLLRAASLRTALITAARDIPGGEVAAELEDALARAVAFQVVPVKQRVIELADRAGNVITTMFLLFSLLSIAAGVLLVFLIFSLLAAARRPELGVTRALGIERGHLVASFTYEGVAYALLAGAAGVPLGLALSRSLVAYLIYSVQSGAAGFTGAGARIAESIRWHADPRSVALAAAAGILLTVASVVFAAWRVSRLTIVTAIRDLPEPAPRRRVAATWWWLGLVPAGAALVALGIWREHAIPFGAGVSAIVVTAGFVAHRLTLLHMSREGARAVGAGVSGAGLAAYWALPFDAQHALGLPRLSGGIELFALAGVMMVAGTVWALANAGDVAARALTFVLTSLGRAAPAMRLAAAHSLRRPLRTGLTLAMFGLVIFMLTVMQVVTAAALHFHADPEIVYGGWHVVGETRATVQQPGIDAPANSGASTVAEMMTSSPPAFAASEITTAVRERPDLARVVAAAGVRRSVLLPVLQLSAPSPAWGGYPVAGIDRGFAEGNAIPLQARAAGYESDAAVWRAVAGGTGFAIVDAHALPVPHLRDAPAIGSLSFTFHGVAGDQPAFSPIPLWVANPAGKQAVKLHVIGVIDRRAAGAFRGLYVSAAQFEALGETARPPAARLYFRLVPGVDVAEARAALGAAFFDQGLETASLVDRFVNEQGPLVVGSRMLQVFVGIGLLVGVAALAVISSRATLERRQEIGVLRAIGYGRATVGRSLLLESALVVLLGSSVGVTLGLVLCRNVFAVRFFDQVQGGMQMVVPWEQLLATVAATAMAALAATWWPARKAARIPPIAAIRGD